MNIYDFPEFTDLYSPSSGGFNILHNTELTQSKVNNSQHIAISPGEQWHVTWRFSVIEAEAGKALRALLNKLRGHQHAVRLKDNKYRHVTPWLGEPVVDGVHQYGLQLDVQTSANNTLIASATNRFRLGDQLIELVDDAVTDSAGKCTLQLANEIRNVPSHNQPLITDISSLFGVFRWSKPDQIKQFEGTKRLYRGICLDFVEVLP